MADDKTLMRDEFGWPIRMVNGERLCARPDCKEDEFRIDGYCSILCRDGDEYEQEIAAQRIRIAALEAENEKLRAVAQAAKINCSYHEGVIALGPGCDCDAEGHICGWPAYKRETAWLRTALSALDSTDEPTCETCSGSGEKYLGPPGWPKENRPLAERK